MQTVNYQLKHKLISNEYKPAYKLARKIFGNLEGRVLDYGCGIGKSSRLLIKWGAGSVLGVDSDETALDRAKRYKNNGIEYRLISKNDLSDVDGHFAAAFSSFVTVEISTKDELKRMANAIYDKLVSGGTYIMIAHNEDAVPYESPMISIRGVNGFNNQSGQQLDVEVRTSPPMYFRDYYWKITDYKEVLENVGFKIEEISTAKPEEGKDISPFIVIKAIKE